MKKIKNNGIFYIVISLMAILGIASFVLAYSLNSNVNVNNGGVYNNYEASQNIPSDISSDIPSNINLGAVSGPDIYSPYLSVNSVAHWFESVGVTIASSTLCAIKSPVATSTLIFGSLQVDTATGTALYVEMGKSATAYATTTSLGKGNIAANAKDTIIASTTPTAAEATIFAPSQYFVVKGANAIGGFSIANAAKCKAEFIEN